MSKPIIEVRGLSKVYRLGAIGATSLKDEVERVWHRVRGLNGVTKKDDFWALRDVSFDVQQGDVVGIIGRNGAGKSTLLKILSRITQQTSGEITLRGRVASLLEVGTGFHQDLTGRENIFLNGAILGMTKVEIRSKLDEIVAFSEIEKFLDTPVKRYSSGMYVRLAFAVAAHLDPEILIVDEVLAVGDAAFQKKCLGKMKDVATGGRTVLFVSHNTAAVQHLCTQCIYLADGTLIASGGVEETLEKYLHVSKAPSGLKTNHLFALESCEFTSAESEQPTRNPVFGRDYRLKIQFQSFQNTRFAIVVEIRDQSGVIVSSINSPEEGHSFQQQKGTYMYDIGFMGFALLPGRFSITIRICDENQKFFVQEEVLTITVEPEHLPGAVWSYNRSHGYARIASESRLSRLGAGVTCSAVATPVIQS